MTASFVEINLHKRIKKVLQERKTSAVVALTTLMVVILAGCALIPGMSGTTTKSQTYSYSDLIELLGQGKSQVSSALAIDFQATSTLDPSSDLLEYFPLMINGVKNKVSFTFNNEHLQSLAFEIDSLEDGFNQAKLIYGQISNKYGESKTGEAIFSDSINKLQSFPDVDQDAQYPTYHDIWDIDNFEALSSLFAFEKPVSDIDLYLKLNFYPYNASTISISLEPLIETAPSNAQAEAIALPSDDDQAYVYRGIDLNSIYSIDLDGDGTDEEISVVSTSSGNEFNFQVNNVSVTNYLNFIDQICLVNLDINDPYIDIVFLSYGENTSDYYFFYFDNETLINRGSLTATNHDGYGIISDNQMGDLVLDGKGGLSVNTRSSSLCSWELTQHWQLDPSGTLTLPPEYYSLYGYGYVGSDVGEPEVTLLMDLPLYSDPEDTKPTSTAAKGEMIRLIQSDNAQWVQIKLENNDLAWFKLYTYEGEDYAGFIEIGSDIYATRDIFDGLLMAG